MSRRREEARLQKKLISSNNKKTNFRVSDRSIISNKRCVMGVLFNIHISKHEIRVFISFKDILVYAKSTDLISYL